MLPAAVPNPGVLLDALLGAPGRRNGAGLAALADLDAAGFNAAVGRTAAALLAQLASLGLLEGELGDEGPVFVVRGSDGAGGEGWYEALARSHTAVAALSELEDAEGGGGGGGAGGRSRGATLHSLCVAPGDVTADDSVATSLSTQALLDGEAYRRRVGRLLDELERARASAGACASAVLLAEARYAAARLLEAGVHLVGSQPPQLAWCRTALGSGGGEAPGAERSLPRGGGRWQAVGGRQRHVADAPRAARGGAVCDGECIVR